METYYHKDKLASDVDVTCYQRLMMYLNHKQYYPSEELLVYLYENGLDGAAVYDKDADYKRMLCAILEILESLTNNIDIFRTVETEFATTSEAYNFLERRIQKLKQKIGEIPDEPAEGGRGGDFTHIFKD